MYILNLWMKLNFQLIMETRKNYLMFHNKILKIQLYLVNQLTVHFKDIKDKDFNQLIIIKTLYTN